MDVLAKDSSAKSAKSTKGINPTTKRIKPEHLFDLPLELLLQIFSFIDVKTLGRLGRTCRQLRGLCRDDVLWNRILDDDGGAIRLRCPHPISFRRISPPSFHVARVSSNWSDGISDERRLVSFRFKEMPRLRIQDSALPKDQSLFFSRGRTIEKRARRKNGGVDAEVEMLFKGLDDDVADFVVATDRVFGVGRNGSFATWPLEDPDSQYTRMERLTEGGKWKGKSKTKYVASRYTNFQLKNAHHGDIHAVAEHVGVFITGSRDCFVKLWKLNDLENREESGATNLRSIPVYDRVWSLACSPDGAILASGTAGLGGVPALRLWTVEGGQALGALADAESARNGAGILHLHFETPHLLLSAGYDTFLRLWDLRMRSSALRLEDPHDNAVYSAWSDDRSPIIITGTARHSVVNIWDRRKIKAPVRMMFANQSKGNASSPVYSMAVEWDRLYVANDQGISVFEYGIYRRDRRTAHVQSGYTFTNDG